MLKTIEWTEDGVRMIDQTRLPAEEVYRTCHDYGEVAEAIRSMVIRGAPAIGVAAAMGVVVGVQGGRANDRAAFEKRLAEVCDYLATSRPTAVNLFWALRRMRGHFARMAGERFDASAACRSLLDAVRTERLSTGPSAHQTQYTAQTPAPRRLQPSTD